MQAPDLGPHCPCKKAKCNYVCTLILGLWGAETGSPGPDSLLVGSRFDKRPCLKGLRQRMIEQDIQNPPLASEHMQRPCTCYNT